MFGAFPSVREQKKGWPPGSRTRRHVHTVETSPCGPRPWYLGPFAERPTLYFFGPCGPRPWYLGPFAERPTLYFFGPCGPRPWYLGPTAERPTPSCLLMTLAGYSDRLQLEAKDAHHRASVLF